METLLESDMLRTVILGYVYLLLVMVVAFVNIYSVDKYEFQYNKQMCFEFKHRMLFIIMYSKEKHIISKKTFILEIIGYLLSIISVVVFVFSLRFGVKTSIILLGIMALIIFAFGCVTGTMYGKVKRDAWGAPKNNKKMR